MWFGVSYDFDKKLLYPVNDVPVDPNAESLIESLETTHEFPCEYTFKAIGRNPEMFLPSVVAAVAEELDDSDAPTHTVKGTPNGRHISVTLTPVVESAQHVMRIYKRLQTLGDLVMWM